MTVSTPPRIETSPPLTEIRACLTVMSRRRRRISGPSTAAKAPETVCTRPPIAKPRSKIGPAQTAITAYGELISGGLSLTS